MILNNRVEIKLAERPPYLEGALLMDEDRVVLVTSKLNPEEAVIYVYDSKGKLLKKHEEKGEIMNFNTINRTEVFGLLPSLGEWIILDVKNFNVKRGKFPFKSTSPFRSRVHMFPESKMMCIWEIGDFNDKAGRLSFLPYPPPEGVEVKPEKVVDIENIFNHVVLPLNARNRIALWEGKVEAKLKWTVIDFEKEVKKEEISIEKPDNGQFCLKNVLELKKDEYLLGTEAMNIDLRYIIYNHQTKDKPRKFDTQLTDNVFDIYSVGPNLFVCDFNVTPEGEQKEGPLTVISKETRKPIFIDKCFIGQGTEYFVGQTNDQYMLRVDMVHHDPEKIAVQTQRATSQKELYVHLLSQLSNEKITNAMVEGILDAFQDEIEA